SLSLHDALPILGIAFLYKGFMSILGLWKDVPQYVFGRSSALPNGTVNAEITPELLGVGYIIGPRIAGILVAGGILSWLVLIPLLSSLVDPDVIAAQLAKIGYLKDVATAGGSSGWDPATHNFDNWSDAIYKAYIRQIGAGAVAAGGFITLIKTIPTIISSFKGSIKSIKKSGVEGVDEQNVPRTERDLSIKVVGIGSLVLLLIIAVLPSTLIPGSNILDRKSVV